MNERIKELAEQVYGSAHNDDFRFAELIIEEMYCFMIDATQNDNPWPDFKQIKQHFGVNK